MAHHGHTQTKAVLNRLSRAIGHMSAVKKMIEEGRDCTEVLIQLSAIRAEITGAGKVLLKDHLEHCVVDAVKAGDEQSIKALTQAIEKLL